MPEPIDSDGLTDKQRVFIDEYFACNLNASEAARRAGYSEKSARQIGSENLTKPYIRQAITERLKQHQMSAGEVIARLTALATVDMADFLTTSGRGVKLDLKHARDLGKLHGIRKYTKNGKVVSIELHDVKDALVQLGRHHALFTDNIAGNLGFTRREKSADEMSDDELAVIAAAAAVDNTASSRPGTDPATPSA